MKSVKEARAVMQRIVDEPIEMFDIFKALEESREEGIPVFSLTFTPKYAII